MNLELNSIDYAALSPLLILLGGSLLVLAIESFTDRFAKNTAFITTLITIIVAFLATLIAPKSSNPLLTPWIRFDSISQFFTLFFLAIGVGFLLLSKSFFQRFDGSQGEYFFLVLSSLFGLILIGSAADFLTIFLGLETLSIGLYVLCGYMKTWRISHEASLKYFIIGSVAAAFLLYGIALIYGATGTTNLQALLPAYQALDTTYAKALFFSGIAFVTFGFAFKAAVVPFHAWAPDVYEGAPTPVTAFMAVGTKVGAFAAFVRVFMLALPHFNVHWSEGIALLVYPTLIYANFVALRQTQLRRFFAYSGISHAGFLLIPVAVGTPAALSSLLFYLVIYAIATLGAFAVVTYLEQQKKGSLMLYDLQGLFKRSPLLAGVMTLCLLTLAGFPPTAGFFAKFYVFKVAFEAHYYDLVIVGLLTSILAVYYYLRIVSTMFSEAPSETVVPTRSWPAAFLGLVSCAAIIILSCLPGPLLSLINNIGK